jgi:hypothetical protein
MGVERNVYTVLVRKLLREVTSLRHLGIYEKITLK